MDTDDRCSTPLAVAVLGTYDAAVVPEIAGLTLDLPGPVAADAAEASAAVAAFDAELGGRVTPYAALLVRAEAATSSPIEHLTASAKGDRSGRTR